MMKATSLLQNANDLAVVLQAQIGMDPRSAIGRWPSLRLGVARIQA